jgi:hypothetical protein
VLAVHRLLRNPEPVGDITPRPAELSGRIDLLSFKLLREYAKSSDCAQSDVRVLGRRLLDDFLSHGRQHKLTTMARQHMLTAVTDLDAVMSSR